MSAQVQLSFAEVEESRDSSTEVRVQSSTFDRNLLALSQLKGLGTHAIQALIFHYGDLELVWSASAEAIADVLHSAKIPSAKTLAKRIVDSQLALRKDGADLRDYLGRQHIVVFSRESPYYPVRLKQIPDPPLWLFVEGNHDLLNQGSYLAVVGSRNSTDDGRAAAQQVVSMAARTGIGLISGLAEGIDAAAHAAAIRIGAPQIAVLGTGIDITFPQSTADLRRKLVDDGGCVITEYLPRDNYGRGKFVQRNRIQAGIAEAVCPVEGHSSSGTMHTVRFANLYGRPLFGAVHGDLGGVNEMPAILADMGTPVFDLALPSGRSRLVQFLDSLGGRRFPPIEHPAADKEFLFRQVLRAVDSVMQSRELTIEDRVRLVDRVRRHLDIPDGDDAAERLRG